MGNTTWHNVHTIDIKTAATIKTFASFNDASGVDLVVTYGRYTYAVNVLGEISMNLIKPVSGSRTESKIAHDVCLAAATKCLATLPAEWHAANARMYAK
jgi:hypothetical protein